MFEHLNGFRNVVVTGPQRSGTRICAKMIAHDTHLRYLDETAIMCDSKYELVKYLMAGGYVIQAPGVSSFIHMLDADNLAVVFMHRPIDDIIASQERIRWEWEPIEKIGYGLPDGPIAQVKYDWWQEQKKNLRHAIDIDYESLRSHPLWVDKKDRVEFSHIQTEA